eukprot:8382309-Karenia_brevis.AAC.1
MVSLVSGTECQAQEPYIVLSDANFPKYREDFETSTYSFTFYGRDNDKTECKMPDDPHEEEFRHVDEAYFDNVACVEHLVKASHKYQKAIEDTTQEAYWHVHKYDWEYIGWTYWPDNTRKYRFLFWDDWYR